MGNGISADDTLVNPDAGFHAALKEVRAVEHKDLSSTGWIRGADSPHATNVLLLAIPEGKRNDAADEVAMAIRETRGNRGKAITMIEALERHHFSLLRSGRIDNAAVARAKVDALVSAHNIVR